MTKALPNVGTNENGRIDAIRNRSADHGHVMNVVLYEQADLLRSIKRKIVIAVGAGIASTILYEVGTSINETMGVVHALPPAVIGVVEMTRAILHRIAEFTARYGVTRLADQNRGRLAMILTQIRTEVPELSEEVRKVEATFPNK